MVNPLLAFGIPNWAWDIIALIISFIAIMFLIRINDMLRKREILPIYISRKVIHIFAGPIFIICWLLFSSDSLSRYFASVVPMIFVFLFLGIGLGFVKNEEFVRTMSRSGEPSELLKGTLFYAIIMVILAIAFWFVPFDTFGAPRFDYFIPTAMLIMGPLAGGDGFADMLGRRFGKRKFKILAEKSVEGTLAMFVFSFLFTYGLLGIYWIIIDPVWHSMTLIRLITPVFIISLVCTIVEVLSPKNFDNLLIPIAAFITIYILWLTGIITYPLIWSLFPIP